MAEPLDDVLKGTAGIASPLGWDAQKCRDFARKYITRRLLEGEQEDVVEELSAYVGAWLYSQDRFRGMEAKLDQLEHDHEVRDRLKGDKT